MVVSREERRAAMKVRVAKMQKVIKPDTAMPPVSVWPRVFEAPEGGWLPEDAVWPSGCEPDSPSKNPKYHRVGDSFVKVKK